MRRMLWLCLAVQWAVVVKVWALTWFASESRPVCASNLLVWLFHWLVGRESSVVLRMVILVVLWLGCFVMGLNGGGVVAFDGLLVVVLDGLVIVRIDWGVVIVLYWCIVV
jgi:hypothetical protein